MKSTTLFRCSAAIAAALIAYAIGRLVFLDAPVTTDENSYVFQAQAFSEGKIARPPPLFKDHLAHHMIIMDERAGWLSRYSPGHSLWLVPGVLLHDPRLMSALAAALSIWLLMAAAARLNIPALVMPLLLLGSPYFLFMHGTLLSHTSGMLAVSALTWAYLAWKSSGRPGYAVLAGLCWSALFLNRTYTACLLAIPFGLDALIDLARRRSRTVLTGTAAFAACALIGIGIYLLYNTLALGQPLQSTYNYYAPGEGLGFGRQVLRDGRVVIHSLLTGYTYTEAHIRLLNQWLFGFTGSLALAGGLAIFGWTARWSRLFVSATLVVWLGYIAFWFPGVNNIGPYYYFETLPLLMLAAALGIARLWRELAGRTRLWKLALALAAVLALSASFHFTWRAARQIRAEAADLGRMQKVLRQAPPQALVILEDVQPDIEDRLRLNARGLQSDPLVIANVDGNFRTPARYFQRRSLWMLKGDGRAGLSALTVTNPLTLDLDVSRTRRQTGDNARRPADQSIVRVAGAGPHPAGWMVFGSYHLLHPARYTAVVTLTLTNMTSSAPVTLDIAAERGRAILAQATRWQDGVRQEVRLDFTLAGFREIEPRVHYGGSGTATVEAIRIEEQAP